MDFHYRKSAFFRAIHADGVYGGISPRGFIHMAFYSERSPIPKQTVLNVSSDGQPIGVEEVIDRLDGFVREVEADVIMDLSAAVSFSEWISEKVEALRIQSGISDSDWVTLVENIRAAQRSR